MQKSMPRVRRFFKRPNIANEIKRSKLERAGVSRKQMSMRTKSTPRKLKRQKVFLDKPKLRHVWKTVLEKYTF